VTAEAMTGRLKESLPTDAAGGRIYAACEIALPSASPKSTVGLHCIYAPVAQLDRATAFEAEGRGFESLQARQTLISFGH
jgi:hypothetical protein